ncbi:unnamed protein product [Periconia digitata]|uniref:Uncharacterized protein n=1 Tax=Periconia digitata TaxID=1303443 RepID=A0A9W4XLU2_9PLEO|nr:unnamed protein product [Periconia digitata]
MTTAIAKYAAQKMLSKEMDKYKSKKVEGPYDPYYEEIPHPRKPGKFKKVKKQIPTYIPQGDAKILAKARKSAYRLDFALFNFMGIRFGWSSVVGIAPVVGDATAALMSLNLIRLMCNVEGGLPWQTIIHMFIYMAIDFGMGLVPVLGDLADAAYKCNGKNVRLLEKHLDKRYKPSELVERDEEYERRTKRKSVPPATVYEDFSDEEEERRAAFDDRYDDVRRPARAHSGQRERIPDEEMGLPRHGTHKSQKPRRDDTRRSRR